MTDTPAKRTRRKISFNISDPAHRYLTAEIAKGRDQTDVINEALRCMAEETPREKILREEIERLHATLERMGQRAGTVSSPAEPSVTDSWKW